MNHLCVSITFLDPQFHGHADNDKPEWPPSPLRVFQALLSAAKTGCNCNKWSDAHAKTFYWLEKSEPPQIIAPEVHATVPYTCYVPNNDSDKAFDRQDRLTGKVFFPLRFNCEDQTTVHYLWTIKHLDSSNDYDPLFVVKQLARQVTTLGWGVDSVVGDSVIMTTEQIETLFGERWLATKRTTSKGLRIPIAGTLNNLQHRYDLFSQRLMSDGSFSEPPLLTRYKKVLYVSPIQGPTFATSAFYLRNCDGSGFSAFDTPRRALTVAGMMRHAVKEAAENAGWANDEINSFILGHGERRNSKSHIAVGPKRFAYLPLPSIEGRGTGKSQVVGSVRRILVTSFSENGEDRVAWAGKTLAGYALIPEGKKQPDAFLSKIKESDRENDKVLPFYTRASAIWTTVTPIVLPGYDDPAHLRRRLQKITDAEEQRHLLQRLSGRIDGLIRKAIIQVGFSDVLAKHAEIDWRKIGFLPGTDHADRYGVPDHLKRFSRYHVRIIWRDSIGNPVKISGPICLGGGRYYGVGLFAAIQPQKKDQSDDNHGNQVIN